MGLGLLTGVVGFASLIPTLGNIASAVFGLVAIACFIAVGFSLIRRPVVVKI
jgi:hypothetical protein